MSYDANLGMSKEMVDQLTSQESVGERYDSPLTKVQREELNALSLEVYGKRLQWQKMLRKGQLKPTPALTSAGHAVSVMQMHHFTVNEIFKTMSQILKDRDEAVAAAKAAEAKKAEEAPTA